ncbi:hypothetical protein Tco_1382618, partial [Tanacetum coccineum]
DTPRDKEIDKLVALISTSFKRIYKPTNKNLITSSNTKNKNFESTLRTRHERQTGQYVNKRATNAARNRDTVQDSDEEPTDQELEAHYMYMAKIQKVIPATDKGTGPIFDKEPIEHVHINNEYNVCAMENENPEQPESVNDTYVMELCDSNTTSDLSNISNNKGEAD